MKSRENTNYFFSPKRLNRFKSKTSEQLFFKGPLAVAVPGEIDGYFQVFLQRTNLFYTNLRSLYVSSDWTELSNIFEKTYWYLARG